MRSPSTLVCGLAAALLATTFPASAVGVTLKDSNGARW